MNVLKISDNVPKKWMLWGNDEENWEKEDEEEEDVWQRRKIGGRGTGRWIRRGNGTEREKEIQKERGRGNGIE